MENSNNIGASPDSWQKIWERKGVVSIMVNTGREFYNNFFRRLFRKHISKNTDLLELGCGTSTLTISIAKEIKNLVGLDISPKSIEISNRHALEKGVMNTSFVLGDCLDIPVRFQESFDLVWSQGLMEHFDNPVLVAKQHYRALKPGGTALISVPYKYSYYTVWYFLTRPKFLKKFWPWTQQVFFSKKELISIGKQVTPNFKTYLLQPFPLGIVILELNKPI